MLHSAFLPEAVKLILRLNAILENQFRKANIGGGFCFSLQLARMSRPKKSWPSLPRIWHAKYDILSKGNLHHSKSDAFIHQVVRCIQMHSDIFILEEKLFLRKAITSEFEAPAEGAWDSSNVSNGCFVRKIVGKDTNPVVSR